MASSLMLTDPGRFATAQRMAQSFAQSAMVPETLRGSMPNCLVALMLADEMGESPLMVMQNIYFIKGRAGWKAEYMIARANQSGKFIGPLRWRSEGKGDDLAVTCYARLRDAPVDDNLVEVTITMAMAKADGWTRNDKYTSIPEHMLTLRSATWLLRRYAPEIMLGYPTSDELEDTMKDITPTKFGIDDFKPGRKPPAPVIEAESADAEKPAAPPSHKDGETSAEDSFEKIRGTLLVARSDGREALIAAWARIRPTQIELLRAGRGDLLDKLDAYYAELLEPLPASPAQEPAGEKWEPLDEGEKVYLGTFTTTAQEPAGKPEELERQQEVEKAYVAPAASRVAEISDSDPLGLGRLPLTRPPKAKVTNWSAWRQDFDHAIRLCETKSELNALINGAADSIQDYNRALPRAAGIFADERTKRMEELPDG